MALFAKHKISVKIGNANHDFWFEAPPNTYTGLAPGDTGVTKVDNATQGSLDDLAPVCTIEALLLSGTAVRKTIRYKVGTKSKYAKLIVSNEKSTSFDDTTGSFRGGTIQRIGNPLDAKFS